MTIRKILCGAMIAVMMVSLLCGCRKDPVVSGEPDATECRTDPTESGTEGEDPVETGSTDSTTAAENTADAETKPATEQNESTAPGQTEKETSPQSDETKPHEAAKPGETPTQTHTVEFRDYDGKTLAVFKVRAGENVTAPPTPSRSGCTFVGWDGSYTNVTEDRILTAQYVQDSPTVREYTVTFKDYDGSVLAVRTVSPGGDAGLPADPVRSGYVFAGWQGKYRDVNADSTVTASYVSSSAPNLFVIGSTRTGSTVQVTLRLTGTINTCAIEARLDYDESVLRYTGMTKHNSVEANHVNRQLILVYAMPQNVTSAAIKDDGVLLEVTFEVIDPDCTDTVLSFREDSMLVDSVDENGAYRSEAFTLTKGVIHLK